MSIDDSFMSFHMLCDQIQSDTSLTVKKDVIRAFVSRYTGDLGLLFKLLLPKQNGRLYQLQDKQLIKLLSIALGQSESTLKNHLNGSGCIGLTASHFFKPRVPPMGNCQLNSKGICTLKLADIDNYLEALSQASGEAQQLNVLQKFLNVACRNALFTFLRSVKQDLHLGAGVRVVLEGLHPSASAIYKRCANIQEVIKRVQAGTADDDGDDDNFDTISNQSGQSGRAVSPGGGLKKGHVEASITLFMPLAPMLASPSNGVDHVLMKTPNGAYSETKYDGERIQIHKQGTTFKFFARSLKPMKPDKYEGLEKYLVEAVKADSCILDGEILLVDIATSKPLPFGTLGKHKRMQFATACTCIFLFDIMYKDGKTLLDAPMDARREYLKSSVQFIQNRVMISEMRVVSGTPDERRAIMQKHLQYAVAEGLEGLVIKDMKSVYGPGTRHWIKLKKDYLQGMADSADLIVLGAWYGSGNKGGVLSTFLMGVWDKNAVGQVKQFKTVVKVGNGHDDMTLAKLNTYFKNSGRMIAGGPGVAPPSWLDINTAHYPDVYIKPMPTADVWEISAAEFSKTKTHTANGVSMRFPRVTKIREDKDLNTATSLEELVKLMEVSMVKGSKLDALGAHQNVASDDEDENEGAHEKGVMMRTSSRYDGPTAIVPGQHFGPLSPSAVAQLQKGVPAGGATSSLISDAVPLQFGAGMPREHRDQLAEFMRTPPHNNNITNNSTTAANAANAGVAAAGVIAASPPVQLKQTPYWVFRTSGFKGDTPPPMPGPEEPDAPLNGSIEYIQGDIAQPRSSGLNPHQNILLIHCCALGPGMKWSARGTMGTLVKYIGDEPEEAYTRYTSSGEANIGDAILVECSNNQNKGRLFVATILGQRGVAGSVPQVDQDAFEKALLVHLLPFAKAHLCSVHIPKMDRNTGVNWGLVDKILRYTYSRQHNLRVVVYQKGPVESDGLARQGTALPASLNRSPTHAILGSPSTLLQRAHTAAPLPDSSLNIPPVTDTKPQTPQITESATKLLGAVKACLFTVEGAVGDPVEPQYSKELRNTLQSMGATVLPHSTFTDDEKSLIFAAATHVIVPSGYSAVKSPDAAEVLLSILSDLRTEGSAAIIVRAEWVSECLARNTLLPCADFSLSRKVRAPQQYSELKIQSPQVGNERQATYVAPCRLKPLNGKFILIIGGSKSENERLTGVAQDLGAIVQDRLRLSEGSGAMCEMRVVRTNETVSVPVGKTTHVLVHPQLRTESAPTDSFREGSARGGSVSSVPLRVCNTTAHMSTNSEVEAVNKALSLGANVLDSTWLEDCLNRARSGVMSLPTDSDYFIDSAVLYSADHSTAARSGGSMLLGTKRGRNADVGESCLPPTPLTKTAVDFEEPLARPTSKPPCLDLSADGQGAQRTSQRSQQTTTTVYQALPPFLMPSSCLVISVHGYGPEDSSEIISQVGVLRSAISSSRQIRLEGNLNLFGVHGGGVATGGDSQQRILICEVLTSTSLPLLKGVAASCRRAIQEPLGHLPEYRAATVVSRRWLEACLEAGSVLPVEPYAYRPAVAFGPPFSIEACCARGHDSPQTEAISRAKDDEGDSTDTASYCTVQEEAGAHELTDVEE